MLHHDDESQVAQNDRPPYPKVASIVIKGPLAFRVNIARSTRWSLDKQDPYASVVFEGLTAALPPRWGPRARSTTCPRCSWASGTSRLIPYQLHSILWIERMVGIFVIFVTGWYWGGILCIIEWFLWFRECG